MAAEYSFTPAQTIGIDENVVFMSGERDCRKGFITHRSGAGLFRLKGASNTCKTVFRVTFNANIAVAEGGAVGEISLALQEDGETLQNAVGSTTPGAVGEFNNVSFSTFITIPFGCCVTVSVKNISDTEIDVRNANIIFDRVA